MQNHNYLIHTLWRASAHFFIKEGRKTTSQTDTLIIMNDIDCKNANPTEFTTTEHFLTVGGGQSAD